MGARGGAVAIVRRGPHANAVCRGICHTAARPGHAPERPPRPQPQTRRFLIDPVKEMVAKGIETATTGAGWLKGGPQMVSDVVCGVVDTWVSVIDPNEGTIRKAMSGDAATLDELASLASTIGSIVFVVYVCMTAVNLFLATAESVAAHKSNFAARPTPSTRRQLDVVSHWLICAQVGSRLLQELPHDSQALEGRSDRRPVPHGRRRPVGHGHGPDPEVHLGPREELETPYDPSLRGLPRLHALGHDRDDHRRDVGLPLALYHPGRPRARSADHRKRAAARYYLRMISLWSYAALRPCTYTTCTCTYPH